MELNKLKNNNPSNLVYSRKVKVHQANSSLRNRDNSKLIVDISSHSITMDLHRKVNFGLMNSYRFGELKNGFEYFRTRLSSNKQLSSINAAIWTARLCSERCAPSLPSWNAACINTSARRISATTRKSATWSVRTAFAVSTKCTATNELLRTEPR